MPSSLNVPLSYKAVTDSSGKGLTSIFLDKIVHKYDVDMNDSRGLDYENGANVVGQQKKCSITITKNFPRTFFNPCDCHSLNLVVADTSKTSVKSVSFCVFLFSTSTKRWGVMLNH